MANLRDGNSKSFIINHWYDKYEKSTVAPEFKWKILDSYRDALRRQLCEGLYILEAGALNKKVEFNRNIICRLEAPVDTLITDKQLKQEINRRRTYNEKIACFIKKMSVMSDDIKRVKGGVVDAPAESNKIFCSRYPYDRMEGKRKSDQMETSTPNARREVLLIEMDDHSPILDMPQITPETSYSSSDDAINETRNKAGVSNEMDSNVITPYKEPSPNTMDRKLAIGARDVVVGTNGNIVELRSEGMPAVPISENIFSKRDCNNKDGKVEVICNKSGLGGGA